MEAERDRPRSVSSIRLSASQLEKICYRLGLACKAGIPIAQAWDNETVQLRGRTRDSFLKVLEQIQEGHSLADSLEEEGSFPAMVTEMVRVGEETGELDQAFLRMADHYRNLVSMKRTFFQGITWPVLQLMLAVVVISLFLVALHVLETKISGLHAPDIFMLGYTPLGNLLLLWGVLLTAAAVLFIIVKGISSGWFGSFPMRIAMTIPLLGSTIKTLALSRFAWAFGMAVDAGMNAQRAMQLGLRSTQNAFYRLHEASITSYLARGKEFFSALRQSGAFPSDLLQAVQSGEMTGSLTESLERLSDDYRKRANLNLRRISQISGFSIFVMVGGMIGFSVMLMYANYLGTISEAMQANSLTLEEIREGQESDNPIIATRNEMVKDFTENNEDFKKIESIYEVLGKYNEMTPDEFLDRIAPDPPRAKRRPPTSPQSQEKGDNNSPR